MFELLQESIRIPNLPATVLLLIVLVYWIINLVGIFDLEILGDGVDVDGHDVDADHDSFLGKTFDFGDLPITIVFSFFALFFWMGTILCNHYLGNGSMLIALVIYIPCIIVGFIITRFISIPLAKGYNWLNDHSEEAEDADLCGSVCTVTIEANATSKGQGEINRNGDP